MLTCHLEKILRQWKYKSHYFPNLTAEEDAHFEKHTGNVAISYGLYFGINIFLAIRSLFRSDQKFSDVPAGYQLVDNVLLG